MKLLKILILFTVLVLFILPSTGLAQSLFFALPQFTVDYFINSDGTASIFLEFVFQNDPSGLPIDYVDVGMPNPNFLDSSISAEIDGKPVKEISRSEYQGSGNAGFAINLGENAIQPGQSGTLRVYVGTIERVLFPDTTDSSYVSTNYATPYFGSQYVNGLTDILVSFHFPEGVQPEEPRWHEAPSGFPEEPAAAYDNEGRIVYDWQNTQASFTRGYEFGASFPASYVPAETIARPTVGESVEDSFGIQPDSFITFLMCCGGIGFIVLTSFVSYSSSKKRKMQYLPPKISIEGHGIKRGLTAVEAAVLLEQPLDKILTMILFSVVKKEAAIVTKRDPLEIKISDPLPDGLHPYEKDFLLAFNEPGNLARRKKLQVMFIDLVQSVSNKMKGFNRKETMAYYQDIMKRAWAQVEAAETPEIKMEKFSENIEWTMLDQDYEDRTRDIFQSGPVFIPTWWHRFDPAVPRSVTGGSLASPGKSSSPGSGGGGITMPSLPGSAFAASIVQGVQNFSSGVVGNLTDFTSGVTNKTNPIPVTTTRSGSSLGRGAGGGGRSCACACACACAGCACACAGGGR
jgi:hypothetical protein